MRNARLDESQAGIMIAGRNINNLRYVDDSTLMAESEDELKSLEESERLGWESLLKTQQSKNKDDGIRSHHFMANRWGKKWKLWQTLFSWAPKSLQMVTAAMKLKDACSLEEKLLTNLDNIVQFTDSVTSESFNPMDWSMPGFSVHQQLPELTQTHVHRVGDAILCHLHLFPPSVIPRIRVFSNESGLHIRWPKYRSFSYSISPSNEYSGLIFFRIDWFDLLAVQGTLKNLLRPHSSKTSIL